VFILDSLLIGGLRFVLDKLAAATDAELNDDSALRQQLLEAQMRLELGELSEGEFVQLETDLLARIREIRAVRHDVLSMTSAEGRIGVEVESVDAGPEPDREARPLPPVPVPIDSRPKAGRRSPALSSRPRPRRRRR
jgi:hypothetical protein